MSKYNPTKGMAKEEMLRHWIEESNKKFNYKFDYSLIKEISTKKSPIEVFCPKHGKFKTTFKIHLKSKGGCPNCGDKIGRDSKRISFEEFIKRLDEVQPKRDYKILTKSFSEKSVLKTQYVYVQGEFGIHKIRPLSMIRKESPAKPFTSNCVNPLQYFINKARKLHNYKYTYNNFIYSGAKEVSYITCPKHGDYLSHPNNHLNGCGCKTCHKEERKFYLRSDTKTFIRKAMNKLGTTENIYDKCVYENAKTKVKIKCDKHGYYEITPNDHLTGYGCKQCANENSSWGLSDYVNLCKNRKPILYKIRMYNDKEEFIKIGITVLGVKQRFSSQRDNPYQYEVLRTIQGDAEYIWKLEKRMLSFFKKHQYIPNLSFPGRTECFIPPTIKESINLFSFFIFGTMFVNV